MNRCFVALFAVVTACARPSPTPSGLGVAPTPAHLRLVVLIVVDQLPTWAFERDRALYKHGFARLLREGGYVTAELPYANTFTAPGHASIGSGAPPSVHGVIGNQWYRRDEGRDRPAEYDPKLGTSSRAMRVEGIAEVLRRATGGRGRSVAVALKARAACFMTGQRPDLAVWFEPDAGGMTTSEAYARPVPPWLLELARTQPASKFIGQIWQPLDRRVLAKATGLADDARGEGDLHGMGVAFPHPIRNAEHLQHSPFADELVLGAAVEAVDAMGLGNDEVPDLLAIGLNAHDYVGHNWGPDSWEVLDLTLRLDAALGELFATFDRRFGKTGWAVVLTSDHGATPIVERSRGRDARRVAPAEIARVVERVLSDRVGALPWVAKVTASQVYLTRSWETVPQHARGNLLSAAARAIAAIPGIAAAGVTDQGGGGCTERTGLARAICLSIVPGESGELYAFPARGSLITDYATGTHHDSPFDDNRRVPILVMAPGVAPATASGSLLQVAPTVAALLGIPPPAAAREPPVLGIPAH